MNVNERDAFKFNRKKELLTGDIDGGRLTLDVAPPAPGVALALELVVAEELLHHVAGHVGLGFHHSHPRLGVDELEI